MRKKTSRSNQGSGVTVRAKAGPTLTAKGASVPRATASSGAVVAVELGAEFPSLGVATLDGAPRRVLTQQEGEGPLAFADRVASALDGALGRGVALGQLVLACNERLDETAQQARRQLAGVALGVMAKQQQGKLILSAPARSSGRLRHGLSALARGLHDEWRTAGLEASVDFEAEAPSATNAAPFSHTARVA